MKFSNGSNLKLIAFQWIRKNDIPTGYCVAISTGHWTKIPVGSVINGNITNKTIEIPDPPHYLFVGGAVKTFKSADELGELVRNGVKIHPLMDNFEFFKYKQEIPVDGIAITRGIFGSPYGMCAFTNDYAEAKSFEMKFNGKVFNLPTNEYGPFAEKIKLIIIPQNKDIQMTIAEMTN